MPSHDSERGAQSINRALSILESFSDDARSQSLTEICERTGLTMPTAHRIAKALLSNRFLVLDPLRGGYALGPAVVRLAFIVLRNSDTRSLVGLVLPYLEKLRSLTGESVGLHIPTEGGRLCVAEEESRHMMRMVTGAGNILPWYAGAASRAMLAYMSEREQRHLLSNTEHIPLTSATVVSTEDLLKALPSVRQKGYAISQGESVAGASAIAKPILDADDNVLGAINITGPEARWPPERMMQFLPDLETAVRTIEMLIGRAGTAAEQPMVRDSAL